MKKTVGLIGFGAIGRFLYEQLSQDDVEFAFIFDSAPIDDHRIKHIFTQDAQDVVRHSQHVDLVIETAVTEVVHQLAPKVLKHTNMLILSVTALADNDFRQEIQTLCHKYNHTLYIPHGAVLGIDGIFDGRPALKTVNITTTKPPASLGGAGSEQATVLYEGPTSEACKLFPRNVNVHACIAFAGLGFDQTHSKIIADPQARGNTHLIEVEAEGYDFSITITSKPVSTVTGASTLAVYSSIKRILFPQGITIV